MNFPEYSSTAVRDQMRRLLIVMLMVSGSLAPAVQALVQRDLVFSVARFVGNTTASSLAYKGTLLGTYVGKSAKRCAGLCAKAGVTCNSFNMAKSGTAGSSAVGRCEVLGAQVWDPANFLAPTTETSTFYINRLYLPPSYFQIIASVVDGPSLATDFPWSTDCMDQNGVAGFMVAFRNNRIDTSKYATHHKCRVFRHSFAMSRETPVTINWNTYGDRNMKCPNGLAITAMYDADAGFPQANRVRCQKPAWPWAVNNTGCRVIDILKKPGDTRPSSPINDPTLSGTADSIWGAQCGTASLYEVLVALKLSVGDLYNESVECCPLYIASP